MKTESEERNLLAEAMIRPLFEEPTEAIERPDPWSGPKGFLLGGMCLPASKQALAEEYFEAANSLVSAIDAGQSADYKVANPVLFLYRHSLELMIKSITCDDNGHNLSALADKLQSFVKGKGFEVPNWIIDRMKELATIDPSSTAFRYGERPCKGKRGREPIPGEIYVSLPHLRRVMSLLMASLISVSWNGEFPSPALLERPDASEDGLWYSIHRPLPPPTYR